MIVYHLMIVYHFPKSVLFMIVYYFLFIIFFIL